MSVVFGQTMVYRFNNQEIGRFWGETMNNMIDLTGQRFGSLTVIRYSPRKTKGNGTYWVCKCDCGQYLLVRSDNLRLGRSTKCSDCHGAGVRSIYCKGDDENEPV